MKIEQIEGESGLTQENIFFYVDKGFLSPARNSNGNRIYSENDLEILKRIRLLRALHISLEKIKLLHTGELELVDVLNQHLQRKKADVDGSRAICEAMCSDGVQYQTLDAQHYLNALDEINTQKFITELASDVIPKVRSPWRRFFARSFDFSIYSTLWAIFLMLVMNVNTLNPSPGQKLLDVIVSMILMIFIEPAMLSVFGTTVGKWILGLRVTNIEGGRLSYSAALSRTWTVLWRGEGLNIPIYNLVRNWKSYKACNDGETLEWEYDSIIILRDEKGWRTAAYIGATLIMIGVLILSMLMAEMPKHRGDITVAEFCENYNRLADYCGIDKGERLNEKGKWVGDNNSVNVFYAYDKPEFIFTEEDGIMTGMQFSNIVHSKHVYRSEMFLSIMSFVRAQKECTPIFNNARDILKEISEFPFEDFKYTRFGITIACDVECSGFTDSGDMLYEFSFSMVKE